MTKIKVILVTLFLTITAVVSKAAVTALSFTGKGYINIGQTWLLSPETGYTATTSRGYYSDPTGNSAAFSFDATNGQHWWDVVFQAPGTQQLTAGYYLGAVRYPFADLNEPAMDITGDGRGSNQVGGWFRVLEISFTANGYVQTAAIDFYHLNQNNPEAWTSGSLRFNSEIPLSSVPEPGTLIGFVGLLGLGLTRKR